MAAWRLASKRPTGKVWLSRSNGWAIEAAASRSEWTGRHATGSGRFASLMSRMKVARKMRAFADDAGGPHPIDAHVGSRLRLRRTMLRISQEKLAAELGLTFQQVQKYERAANRISASRLYQLCRILKIPISFFFEGLEAEGRRFRKKAVQDAPEQDPLRQPEAIELAEAYYRISNPQVRARFLELVRAAADNKAISMRRGRPRRSPRVRTPSKKNRV
jgi:transcriptional regulator with XRE-family HTH domain